MLIPLPNETPDITIIRNLNILRDASVRWNPANEERGNSLLHDSRDEDSQCTTVIRHVFREDRGVGVTVTTHFLDCHNVLWGNVMLSAKRLYL